MNAFLDRLPHRIKMERMRQTIRPFDPESFQSDIPGRSGKGEEADVWLWPPRLLVFRDHVLDVVACR